MLMLLHLKATCDQFRLNRRKFRRCDHNICVSREHRRNVAIDGQTADETPLTVAIQNLDQQSEIAASPVGHRFEDFSCSHLLYGVRRQSEAATALWFGMFRKNRRSKAVSRFACHRTPNLHSLKYSGGAHAATDAHRDHA